MSDKPSAISGIGGVTEFRLERELGVETVGDLVGYTVEDLQDAIWGVGEVRAQRLVGWSTYANKQSVDEVLGSGQGREETRVAMVGFPEKRYQETFDEGGDVTEELDTERGLVCIKKALDKSGFGPSDEDERNMEEYLVDKNVVLGWAENAQNMDVDENGGTLVRQYHMTVAQETGKLTLGQQTFPTHWEAYAESKEVPTWHAAKHRDERMVEWADHVICFKPGVYEERLAEMVEEDRFTEWHSPEAMEYELEKFEPSEEDTKSSHRSTPVPIANWRLVLEEEQQEEKEARREERDAEVGKYDRSEFNPHQVEDLTEGFHYTSDNAEQRPEGETFTDGKGQPSRLHSEDDSDVDWTEVQKQDRETVESKQ